MNNKQINLIYITFIRTISVHFARSFVCSLFFRFFFVYYSLDHTFILSTFPTKPLIRSCMCTCNLFYVSLFLSFHMYIGHTGEITAAIAGGSLLLLAIVSLVLYRNWKYEQELDSLLWKVDYKEIQLHENDRENSCQKQTRVSIYKRPSIHPIRSFIHSYT